MPRRKPTVAIVEDDKDTAIIWQRKLIRSGFVVVGNQFVGDNVRSLTSNAERRMTNAEASQRLVTSSPTAAGPRVPPVPPTETPRLIGIPSIRSQAGSTDLHHSRPTA